MHGGGAVGGGHGGFAGQGGLGGGHHGGFGGHHHPGAGGDALAPVIPRGRRKDSSSSPPFGPAQTFLATPPAVLAAIRLYLASAAAIALGGVLAVIASLRLLHAGAARGAPQAAAASTVGGTFVTVAVITAPVLLGLKLFVAGRLRRGRNRARIAVLVLAVLDLGAMVLRAGSLGRQLSLGPLSATALVVEVLGLIALVAAAVLLFRPDANTWFRSRP